MRSFFGREHEICRFVSEILDSKGSHILLGRPSTGKTKFLERVLEQLSKDQPSIILIRVCLLGIHIKSVAQLVKIIRNKFCESLPLFALHNVENWLSFLWGENEEKIAGQSLVTLFAELEQFLHSTRSSVVLSINAGDNLKNLANNDPEV